ncbi:MAG: metallophosphoesterase family protein [Bacteroidales bacterium]|nr:metallophosphoesterase family protein [Bacteroidales bacterium]
MAIGDIHGCYQQLYLLVTEIIDLTKDDKLVMLGDYIDRGPDSKAVLDLIMDLISEDFDIIPLMGNHEDMMLNAAGSANGNYNWMMNGGGETLQSFNVQSVSEIDGRYISFLSAMPVYHTEGHFIFVHGGFNDELDDPFSDKYSMLWERRFEYTSPVFKDKVIVHGHRPHPLDELQKQIEGSPSVINVDTGCVYGKERGLGDLTAIDLLSMKLYSA